MMSIGVLVTNYNSWALATACVAEHRRLHGDRLARIILLDDCSPTAPTLLPPGVDLIRNERNLGFAASLNRGIRELDTDLVVIFDADAFPLTPYYGEVEAAFLGQSHLGLLGFATINSRGQHTESTLDEPDATSLLAGQWLHGLIFRWMHKQPGKLCITTAAMVVRRQAFEEAGGFDERLSWMDVDTDFSMQLNRSIWKLCVQKTLVARHEAGGTPMSTSEKVERFYVSRWYLLRKHGLLMHRRVFKAAILTRIILELIFLWVAGWLIYAGNAVKRQDKTTGRLRLLSTCYRMCN